jgi:hypothetical protein
LNGLGAADEMIQRIAQRAATTAFRKNEKTYGFERRGGALVRVPRPDPLRATAPFEHRDDGYIV